MSEDSPAYRKPEDVDFGLPNIHLKPLSKKKEAIEAESRILKPIIVSSSNRRSTSVGLAIFLVLLLLVVSAGLYYAYENGYLFQPKKDVSNASIPPTISESNAENTVEVDDNEGWNSEEFIQTDTIQENIQSEGSKIKETIQSEGIETKAPERVLTELLTPTNKYHIIIASVPSVELAREDGNKLLDDNVSLSILYPRAGRNENFRISAASFATLDEATKQLTFYRQKYGESVWVLRY